MSTVAQGQVDRRVIEQRAQRSSLLELSKSHSCAVKKYHDGNESSQAEVTKDLRCRTRELKSLIEINKAELAWVHSLEQR